MSEQFPPNSHKSKAPPEEPRQVDRVTSSEAVRRKKGLGRQFKGTFFGGDGRTAIQYVVFEVLIPAAKDALADAGAQGIERLIFGEGRRKPGARPSGPAGYVQYNRFSTGGDKPPIVNQRAMSQRARATHNFDDIVLDDRREAEAVIDQMFEYISKFDSVSVADLYAMVGIRSSHTDYKWGWQELRGAGVSSVRGGYLLDLPEPEILN